MEYLPYIMQDFGHFRRQKKNDCNSILNFMEF